MSTPLALPDTLTCNHDTDVADVPQPEGEEVAEEDSANEEKPAADQGKRLRRMRRRF